MERKFQTYYQFRLYAGQEDHLLRRVRPLGYRETDKAGNIQNNGARWYEAITGRWLSEDPAGFAAGDANLYRYVGNNPTILVDPSGLAGMSGASGGGMGGGGVTVGCGCGGYAVLAGYDLEDIDGQGPNEDDATFFAVPLCANGCGGNYSNYEVCFAAGTPVLTADGSWKKIEELQPGEMVMSSPEGDPEGKVEAKPIVQVYHNKPQRLLEVHLDGGTIRTTENHHFHVRGKGWTPAAQLVAGDSLRGHDGQWEEVTQTVLEDKIEPVFNLQVADYHTYFVGAPNGRRSVLVHNQSTNAPNTPTGGGGGGTFGPWGSFFGTLYGEFAGVGQIMTYVTGVRFIPGTSDFWARRDQALSDWYSACNIGGTGWETMARVDSAAGATALTAGLLWPESAAGGMTPAERAAADEFFGNPMRGPEPYVEPFDPYAPRFTPGNDGCILRNPRPGGPIPPFSSN